jgi:hypothetical protein
MAPGDVLMDGSVLTAPHTRVHHDRFILKFVLELGTLVNVTVSVRPRIHTSSAISYAAHDIFTSPFLFKNDELFTLLFVQSPCCTAVYAEVCFIIFSVSIYSAQFEEYHNEIGLVTRPEALQ